MDFRLRISFILFLFQVLLPSCIAEAKISNTRFLLTSNDTKGVRHAPGLCAMYDICGSRSDGKVLNCPLNAPAVKPDALLSSKIQSLCPTITADVCCTERQFDTLRSQVQQVNNSLTVDAIEFYVTDTFGEGLYNSCKDVKFGTMNTRAIEFVAGGAKDFKGWFAFIGRQVGLNVPGSPYAINFTSNVPESSGMRPMNVSAYACGDTSLGCSCGDCPSSPSCSNSAAPPISKSSTCSIRMGSMKARCSDVVVAVVFVVSLSVFLGWGFVHQKKKMNPASRTKPLTSATSSDGRHSSDLKDGELPVPILRDGARRSGEARLSLVQGYMSNFYRKYGAWVARKPALVLFSSLAIVLILCLGLIRLSVETRPEKKKNEEYMHGKKVKNREESVVTLYAEKLIIATIPNEGQGKSPSILTEDNIKLLFEIQKKVDGIQANYFGSMISLTDICYKPLGQDCATQSILQYFKMNAENFDSLGGVDHVMYCFEHYSTADNCRSAFKAPLDPSTALGGYSGNNYSEASAFTVSYPVNNAIDRESNQTKRAVAWEKAFIELAKDELITMVQAKNLTLAFSSESSIEEELKRESTADISYLVMFAYISLTLGDKPRLSSFYISSKVLLGLSGVVLVMLSVLGSVGFFSAIGVKSTLIIMEVIPFLVLAVGVDNMCILVNAVKRQPQDLPLEGRISNALVEVGPSISLASLSEVLAFAVGTFIPMPAVRVFSMFAALAVLLDFLLQVTAFVALIVFDFKRTEDHRVDCAPCLKVSSFEDSNNEIRKPGLLARYMKTLCTRIEPGLEQQIVLPRDSYLQGYFKNISDYLRIGPPVYFVVKDYNYSSQSQQTNQLCSISHCDPNSLVNEIIRASIIPESSYIAKPAASWIDDFLVWMSPEAFGCCRKFVNGSYCPPDDQLLTVLIELNFFCSLLVALQTKPHVELVKCAKIAPRCAKGGHGAYTNSVDLQGYENGIIQASEFRTYHTPLNKQTDFVNALRAAREFTSRMSKSLKGVMAILEIQLNAVSVVNLVMSVGIAVEFCVSGGDRDQRMKEALGTMGASVFSGITLTKLVGVIVLAFARSQVFVVVLSLFGPPSRLIMGNEDARPSTSSQF
ncbi:NPC intracellular cholesterol transporter 1 [Bienertia sinuspersici]